MTNNVRKKILYFIPEFPRLTETFIEREVSKLIGLGNLDITVFSLKKASGVLSPTVSKHTVYKRLNFADLTLAFCYFGVLHPVRVFSAFSLVLGKDPICFAVRLGLFVKAVGYAFLFRKYKPQHIHGHFLSWPSTVVMVVAHILGVPFSISGHARDVTVDGSLIPIKVKTAKFISICNKNAYQFCIDHSGIPNPKNIYQQYHGVPADKLTSDNAKLAKSDRPFIFVGSRLVEKKGLSYVIEASKILKERGINYEMHIVGPGPLYAQLTQQITQLNLNDFVTIHGGGQGLPWAEVVEFFKIADIFAHPSIDTDWGDADGVPTFMIEAAFAKLPIVTTNAGSITDLIIDAKTGILVPQKNANALADAFEKLIFDSDLRAHLGENAHVRAKEMFDLAQNIKALERLFLLE